MSYESYYQTQEALRQDALRAQDAVSYVTLCHELGAGAEDPCLYGMGMAALRMRPVSVPVKSAPPRSKTRNPGYALFLAEADELSPSSFERNTLAKSKLLAKAFPGRFGENGLQKLPTDPVSVGALFQTMYTESRKRA